MSNLLNGKDILSAMQFNKDELNLIMNTAAYFERKVKNGEEINNLVGTIVASLFFEPSTRTRLSFESAANRVGAKVVSMAGASSSSTAKGESLVDTIRTVDGYVDAIIMRHPMKGAADIAAKEAVHPILNGGDWAGQHPTQDLLDIYTMRKEKGFLGGHTVTFLGDLKYGRTVHSLGYFMNLYNNRMIFASPDSLKMPAEITADLRSKGANIVETGDVEAALAESDIVYVTRVQRERFEDIADYEKVKGIYVVDRELINKDDYEGAAYFRQAHNGMYVRMALLALVTGRI